MASFCYENPISTPYLKRTSDAVLYVMFPVHAVQPAELLASLCFPPVPFNGHITSGLVLWEGYPFLAQGYRLRTPPPFGIGTSLVPRKPANGFLTYSSKQETYADSVRSNVCPCLSHVCQNRVRCTFVLFSVTCFYYYYVAIEHLIIMYKRCWEGGWGR